MLSQSLLCLSLVFCMISIILVNNKVSLPIEKIGVIVFPNDYKWVKYIYKNLNNLEKVKTDLISDVFKIKNTNYYVHFIDSWLFDIIESESQYKLGGKYSLGGQSNKADYLTKREKVIGGKIENWYINFVNKNNNHVV